MAMATALLILLFTVPAVFAAQFTVGNTAGWNTGVDYSAWVSGKRFAVGDTLLFNYDTTHRVDVVNKADYDNCAAANPIQSIGGTSATIPLNSTGSIYFLCPISNHCSQGMKLAINVSAASTPPPRSATPPAATPPTSPPTTPSPPTTTPSPPNTASPPPTTTESPPPTTTTSPPPPPKSGANGNLYNMNALTLGASLVLAPVLAFMG